MLTNMPSPLLWRNTPFADTDAFLDFLGMHSLAHSVLAAKTKTLYIDTDDLGGAWRSLVSQGLMRRGALQVTPDELQRHALMHQAVDAALGVATAYDLTSYNLSDPASFAGFMLTHSLQHALEAQAA
jgi:hypothetical protein